jgi:microcin C transport system permease protein
VPLGIRKAVHDGSAFDAWTSLVILIAFAIPGFVLAMLLIIVFAGGEFLNWFPLRGLISDNYTDLSLGREDFRSATPYSTARSRHGRE